MKKMFRVMLAFLFGTQAYAQKGQKDELSVLFVGNSYTHMNEMPSIFDKICKSKGKTVHVEKNTRSGASFNVHTTRPDLFVAIKSRQWDYIVLQGYSRELSFAPDYLDTATMPFINTIIDSIKANNPCTNIVLQMTWGYKEGFEEREETSTYETMSDLIADGYQYLSDSLNIPIVPVGKVWRKVRESNPEIELFDADKAHPSKNGSYLSACTFYASMFKESPEGAMTSTISNAIAPILQKAAGEFVLKSFERYRLSQNFHSFNWSTTPQGEYVLKGVASFQNASSVKWDFGDGSTSTEKKVSHKFKRSGRYKVLLTVEDECGTREIIRKVKFTTPRKPTRKPKIKPTKGNKPKKKS